MTVSRLHEFCHRVREIVGREPVEDVPRRISPLMPPLLADAALLTATQRALPAKGYARHEVFVCPSEAFSVLAVVWPPGITTPIHDHLTWCAFAVYEGVIRETRFEPAGGGPGGPLASVSAVAELRAGDSAHLPVASPNIHSIHNPTREAAISIHVYGGNARRLGANVETIYGLAA